MDENEIRKIAYNCKKATFLIEKKHVVKLTLREKLELKIHLSGCSVCRIFQQQSLVINQLVKELFNSIQTKEVKLDETFKMELQEKINAQLNKN